MKNKNFLVAIPFLGYGLFLATIYKSTTMASYIFFVTVLATIGTTIFLFRNERPSVENVEKN